MRGESMKDKSKKSTYSTTFGVDPFFRIVFILKSARTEKENPQEGTCGFLKWW